MGPSVLWPWDPLLIWGFWMIICNEGLAVFCFGGEEDNFDLVLDVILISVIFRAAAI